MPRARFVAQPDVAGAFASVRAELGVPGSFPPGVEHAAASETGGVAVGPTDNRVGWVTLDPIGSRDLDQAFHLERQPGGGWRLAYAIADVAAHVRPGGPVDAEAHVRGLTLYLPDGKAPLHPVVLSEGRASLLPGQPTPALVWEIDIAADGSTKLAGLARRTVTSGRQLDYLTAPHDGDPQLALLSGAGRAMASSSAQRGALDLPEPTQEIVPSPSGQWDLVLSPQSPFEQWNAQMSLAVGRAAGSLQASSGWGLLRTLPPARSEDVELVRASAVALGHGWEAGESWTKVVNGLTTTDPTALAVVDLAGRLLRGAGYHVLREGRPIVDAPVHAAVASVYAHATAPLRRLGDRYVSECCLAAVRGVDPPEWAIEGLVDLDVLMIAANRRAAEVDRACLDTVEATLLESRVGEIFGGVAVDERTVQIHSPVVRARCDGQLAAGTEVQARLTKADVATRTVRFSVVDQAGGR